jgi:hypothetical protein
MKRLSIILAFVLLLPLLAAAPALGDAVTPEPGAYVFPMSGEWTEVTPTGALIYHAWTPVDPDDPEGEWLPPDPIPSDLVIWMAFSWYAPGKGLVQTLPLGLHYRLDVMPIEFVGDDVVEGDVVFSVPTYAAGAAFWSRLYMPPQDVLEPFNPNIGAKIYARDWWAKVGYLEPDVYGVRTFEKITHSVADLSRYPEIPDQHTPILLKRGVNIWEAAFMVVEP